MSGMVYLVGAGPGDPGLLTVKAARVLARADVVVYDHLVADAIVDRLPPTAERVYAGKETGTHVMNQGAINALLEARARLGQRVVRLKGGDPFVFGRGGEEAEHLAAQGIPFEIVPGVTSAIAVPAYAGIPVTHRGAAASLAVVTGRAGPVGEAPAVQWERIAGADTIVVLMGIANHDHLIGTLLEAGRSPETPVAVIRWGTTARQRVVIGTLGTIGTRLREGELRPPAILVVGHVVSLSDRMRWAEQRPLFGRRVLVPAAFPSPLTEPLEDLGAEVLHASPTEMAPPRSWEDLDEALRGLASLTGIVFVDETGVGAVIERLIAAGRDTRVLSGLRIVAGDTSAAVALARVGIRADGLSDELERDGSVSGRDGGTPEADGAWLIAGCPGAQARTALTIRQRGGRCCTPSVSVEATPKWRADRLRELFTTHPVHAVVVADAAQARRLLSALDLEERRLLRSVAVAASPDAAEALRRAGIEPSAVAAEGTPEALVAAAVTALGKLPD